MSICKRGLQKDRILHVQYPNTIPPYCHSPGAYNRKEDSLSTTELALLTLPHKRPTATKTHNVLGFTLRNTSVQRPLPPPPPLPALPTLYPLCNSENAACQTPKKIIRGLVDECAFVGNAGAVVGARVNIEGAQAIYGGFRSTTDGRVGFSFFSSRFRSSLRSRSRSMSFVIANAPARARLGHSSVSLPFLAQVVP
jgi:hypothetical protein